MGTKQKLLRLPVGDQKSHERAVILTGAYSRRPELANGDAFEAVDMAIADLVRLCREGFESDDEFDDHINDVIDDALQGWVEPINRFIRGDREDES